MKKILVTGGTGYIGSHTVVRLLLKGFEVTITDNLSNSNKDVLKGIKKITGKSPVFFKLDLKNRQRVKKFFKNHNDFDGIIHFAAYKAVGESVFKPLKYYENNLISLINILKAMKKHKIPNLVFSSSCTVYGQPDKLPVTENSPIKKADSPYGNTKQIAEEIISETVKADKYLKAIILRYFNPIGAHESGLIGELPLGVPDNLVPYITQTAAGIRKELKIFGNDYNTPDGTAIRDYIHVEDLAEAHIAAFNKFENSEDKIEIYNIGTGKGNSVKEVVEAFEKVTKQKLNFVYTERRKGDIEKVWANTSPANEKLNWKAEKTLEEALSSAWNWEKNYRKLNKTK